MIRLTILTSVAVLALAACNAPPEPTPAEPAAPVAMTPADPTSATASQGEVLTPEGFGLIRIGQTIAEVEQAYGAPARPITDHNACNVFHPARAPEGLLVMTEEGRVSRVSLSRDAKPRTDRALGLGATAAEVKRVYGAAAQSTPHKYQSAPAEYITVWTGGPRTEPYVTDAAARGIVYEVNTEGRVFNIHAGGPSIQLVESCS